MTVFVRFAPSPTGYLHAGNIRTALVNYLFARAAGGRFMLRLDDTDTERSKAEYEAAIEEDLRWLGMQWDDFKKQSDRFTSYEQAKQKLIASGRLYPCYETAAELDMQRKLQAGRGQPPIYNRAALQLTPEQKAKYEAEGHKPHYRFLLEDKPIVWNDLVRGEVRFQGAHVSDPVLIREDGVPLYTLASVVDDGEMGITHILRGEDHVSNTAVQFQIFEALGFTPPQFGHLALLKTKEGELSKRVGGNDIRGLREAGIEPMTINSLLAKLGTSDPVEPFTDMKELIESFDIKKFGRAAANYDPQELERLNEKLLHKLPFSSVKERLSFADEPFWLSIRANLKTLAEAKSWWDIIHGEVNAPVVDASYLQDALALLPPEPWDETAWGTWTKAISAKTGRKGKELFLPLRLALTGVEHGPEMKQLLPLIGYNKVAQRLNKI
ncbi:MAG TPA: glutamate--tRNA ligase [Rickettsiales bacterium]|nr:glutamate--tRNA ligase [Rickettsiales bacterium]